MAKKIIIAVVVLVVALGAYFGGKIVASMRNTPVRAGNTFMSELASGDSSTTYAVFTNHAKRDYTKAAWKDFVDGYAKYASKEDPVLIKNEDLKDRFNTYAGYSKPTRLIYETKISNRKYQMKIILLKSDNLWKVDDLQGNYAE